VDTAVYLFTGLLAPAIGLALGSVVVVTGLACGWFSRSLENTASTRPMMPRLLYAFVAVVAVITAYVLGFEVAGRDDDVSVNARMLFHVLAGICLLPAIVGGWMMVGRQPPGAG
jgi:hypothetical protein